MLLSGFGRVNVEAQTPEPSEESALAFAEQEERRRTRAPRAALQPWAGVQP
jgi:hypothetical protein